MANTPVSARTVSEALHWRYATKKFDTGRKIPAESYRSPDDGYGLSGSFGSRQRK